MLSKPDVQVVFNDAGKATGVTSEGETVQAKFVVGDPSAHRPPAACRSTQASLSSVLRTRHMSALHCLSAEHLTFAKSAS